MVADPILPGLLTLRSHQGCAVPSAVARRPPDQNHPYGHRKYETMASLGILIFLVVVLVEVVTASVARLRGGAAPTVFPAGIGVMVATLIVNLAVVAYETREGRRLNSEVLLADVKHTRSNVLTSVTAMAALVGVGAGYPLLDPLAALLVAGFIGHACWEIAQSASRILSDETVLAEADLQQEARCLPSSDATRSGPVSRPTTCFSTCTSGWTATRRSVRRTRHRTWRRTT